METSPYRIPETALRSWDPHSKRKAYFEGQEEALRQAQSKTPKKAIHALIEEAIKATSARVRVEGRDRRPRPGSRLPPHGGDRGRNPAAPEDRTGERRMDPKEPSGARTHHRGFLCNRTLKGGDSHV